MITERVLNALEFNKILDILAGHAHSDAGREFIRNIKPCKTYSEAEYLQALTNEAVLTVTENKCSPNLNFDDISGVVKKCEISSMLTLGEFLKTARHLNIARNVKASLNPLGRPLLKVITDLITPVKILEDKINKIVISDSEIADSASDKLYSIRRKIRNTNDSIKNKLTEYIKSSSYNKFLQDSIVTVRSGRYVIPVKQEYKSNISGLIHDQSASGATVFVEPMAIVEYNNELKTLIIEETVEIERIIAELTGEVAGIAEILSGNNMQLIILDTIFAKCDFALEISAYKPSLNKTNRISIVKGRHPLLGAKAVPIDLSIDNKILMISGPNTGGKTVALKTVGLFALMSMSGLFIPASEADFPVFTSVYCDIGDEQSIENALSTFSSHMKNIIDITDNVDKNSLVLLDEIGAGTDPAEGAALSIGITKYLIEKKCTAIITTHFYELKEFSINNSGVINASMQFDPKTFRPTYRILSGLPGSSNALKISEYLGLSKVIIGYAEENLSNEKIRFENTLREAEAAKMQADSELTKYDDLNKSLAEELNKVRKEKEMLNSANERLRLNAKAETRRQVQKYLEEADELIDDLKDKLKAEDERALLEARRIKTKLADVIYKNDTDTEYFSGLKSVDADNIKIGDEVILITHNLKAKIINLDAKKSTAEISTGNISLTAAINDLAYPSDTVQLQKQNVSNVPQAAPSVAPPMEIKLLGQTVSEAVHNLEEFIYNAASRNVKIIHIVHGVGTGALKKGIHQYLHRHPMAESYRLGQHGEGGGGVTVLTIK